MKNIILFIFIVLIFIYTGYGEYRAPVTMEFNFLSASYKGSRLPSHCLSFIKITDRVKQRPLFIMGYGYRGRLNVIFDTQKGILDKPAVTAEGKAEVQFNKYCITSTNMISSYSAAMLVEKRVYPRIEFSDFYDWKTDGYKIMDLLYPKAAYPPPRQLPPPPIVEYEAKCNIKLIVGDKIVELKQQQCRIFFTELYEDKDRKFVPAWQIRIESSFWVPGENLGISEGEVEIFVITGAYSFKKEEKLSDVKESMEDKSKSFQHSFDSIKF